MCFQIHNDGATGVPFPKRNIIDPDEAQQPDGWKVKALTTPQESGSAGLQPQVRGSARTSPTTEGRSNVNESAGRSLGARQGGYSQGRHTFTTNPLWTGGWMAPKAAKV